MLQRKPGIHRQQDPENSDMKITNLHILKRRLLHRPYLSIAALGSSTASKRPMMERSTMHGFHLAFSEYHEQIGALCAVGNGSLSAGDQRLGPLRCGGVGFKTVRCR